MRFLGLVLGSLLLVACGQEGKVPSSYTLVSPNGQLQTVVQLSDAGEPLYRIEHNGSTVLHNSVLGVELEGVNLYSGLALSGVTETNAYEDNYTLLHGKKKSVAYRANEQVYSLQNSDGEKLDIAFRVSNDGVAFQYRFPRVAETPKIFVAEKTSFAFPKTAKAWMQHMDVAQEGWSNTFPSYEAHYQMEVPVGTESPSKAGWLFPALFHSEGSWLAISEAGMDGSYHASRIKARSPNGVYSLDIPMAAEVKTNGLLLPVLSGDTKSPWRIIAVGDLPTLVNSTLGTDLANPVIEKDFSFVKPGVASWSWALGKDDSVNYDTQIEYIDYAASLGWDYTLIDVNWDENIGYDGIAKLAGYAAQKNVKLILWYNSSGDWNTTVYSPKSKLLERQARRKEFERIYNLGIAGVKVDFFAGDGVSMIKYYTEILEDAADFKLLANFHGATLPRGWHRTYPNLMTVEAVHGFEMTTFFQTSTDKAPAHIAMQPFTRNLFDPMDYTPTTFGEITSFEKRTRNGMEIAMPILFLSGIQHIAESPTGMKATPDYVQTFMQNLPVAWDESRLLQGYPGKLAIIARRKGDTWFVAGVNGENLAKSVVLDLSFIAEAKGLLITDGEGKKIDDPTNFSKSAITNGSAVTLTLKPHGGFVAKF